MLQTLTHCGWMGIAPQGREISMRSLEDGKFRENWVLVDLLVTDRQLGVDVSARLREFNKARNLGPIAFAGRRPKSDPGLPPPRMRQVRAAGDTLQTFQITTVPARARSLFGLSADHFPAAGRQRLNSPLIRPLRTRLQRRRSEPWRQWGRFATIGQEFSHMAGRLA